MPDAQPASWSGRGFRRSRQAKPARAAGRDELEAVAARAAHPERVPAGYLFQPVVLLEEHHEHLVGSGGIPRTSRRGDDGITASPYEMTVACRSSTIPVSRCSSGASLLRTSPPRLPSVVDDASNNCSSQMRRMNNSSKHCHGHAAQCRRPWSDAWRKSSLWKRRRGRACSKRRRYPGCLRPRRRIRAEP